VVNATSWPLCLKKKTLYWGATNDVITWRISVACWKSKATCTHASTHRPMINTYCLSMATMISESALLLRYTYIVLLHLYKPHWLFCVPEASTFGNSAFCPRSTLLWFVRYQNQQRFFPYTAKTDWFFNGDSVFTAQYELNLWTNEEFRLIFALKGLTGTWKLVNCKTKQKKKKTWNYSPVHLNTGHKIERTWRYKYVDIT
jgi:hypothetical protein